MMTTEAYPRHENDDNGEDKDGDMLMMMVSTITGLAAWTEQHGHNGTALADCLEDVG